MPENSDTPGPRAGGNFVELMWQKTCLLFMLYLLARWLTPSFLPEFKSKLSWFDPKIVFICAIPGAIWAGISLLMRVGGEPPQQK